MANTTITSLALLKVNWDAEGTDYLDNFVVFVAESIRLANPEVVSLPALQTDLRTRFGLNIPQNALETILKRVRRKGYIASERGAYVPNPEKLSELNFRPVQQQVLRSHDELMNSFVRFCSERFEITLTESEAEAAIQSYLEEHDLQVIGALVTGSVVPHVNAPPKSAKFLVASFVKHLQDTDSGEFDHFETIVKGNMLANAVFLPDPAQVQRKFRHTEVYFDTSFLIYALGYAGEPRQEPCRELLQLLFENGADLRCFTHTVDEIRGALDACAIRIKSGQLSDAYGPSIEYFLSMGYSASDVQLFSVRTEKDLQALRITVREKPEYAPEYLIDEVELGSTLDQFVSYSNPYARNRDIDSISAIMRLRRGQRTVHVENCKAIFITTNRALVAATHKFFHDRESSSANLVSPCLTDYTLTNILWLKTPLRAPGLPRKRIIADWFAAARPPDHLWAAYVQEISRLEKLGNISPEDCYLLRHSIEAQNLLMERTLGDPDAFTRGTVPEIIETIHSRLQASLKRDLEQQQSATAATQAQLAAAKAREEQRNRRIQALAVKWSSRCAVILTICAYALLAVGIASTFPWNFPTTSFTWYAISLLQVVVLLLATANLVFGSTIRTYVRKFEVRLSNWLEIKLLHL